MDLDEVKSKIELRQGDITELDVDVIVNSANTDLILGAGVAGEIGRRGGDIIQEECNRIGSVPLGGAVETAGGALKAQHVIHAASVEVGHFATERNVAKATRSALLRAEELQAKTIAFPPIGPGAAFPMHRCARVMLDVVSRHLASKKSALERVHFVVVDADTLTTFEEALARLGAPPRPSRSSRGRRSRRGGSRNRGNRS